MPHSLNRSAWLPKLTENACQHDILFLIHCMGCSIFCLYAAFPCLAVALYIRPTQQGLAIYFNASVHYTFLPIAFTIFALICSPVYFPFARTTSWSIDKPRR